jgi:HPt (histidine-containing phosphotransfer) domain-containing protein
LREPAEWGGRLAKTRPIRVKFGKRSVNQFRDWLGTVPAAKPKLRREVGQAMPLHLERINWMSSPPLVPDDGPIDFEHLSRMTLGDPALESEVLTMFAAQSARLLDELAALPPGAGALAHTLKGSARAIGAFAVAEAAGRLEAALGKAGEARAALDGLGDAVAAAQGAIEVFLGRG